MGKHLANSPLIEAIFEFRWLLHKDTSKNIEYDENYNFLIGLFYNGIKDVFPIRENLPSSQMPAEIIPYVPQFRFSKKEKTWPLVQLGPGILTVNDTDSYTWDNNFEDLCCKAIQNIYKCYPDTNNLNLKGLTLRYINALKIDDVNILEYMHNLLKLEINFPQSLFEETEIHSIPNSLSTVFSFPISKPEGMVMYKFAKGKKDNKDALIWEISIISKGEEKIELPTDIGKWLSDAHNIAEKSFFAFSEGELYRSFENV